MKKLTLTPQPRKSIRVSISAVRPIALSSRHSLNPEDNKPQRNVCEKQYKQECVENILAFLVANNYDGQVTAKTLHNPSNREFQNIFKFVYSFIDPSPFIRFEDDVLNALKILKYPYCNEITRSQLAAVTPHTWPVILSMINWLVNLVKRLDDTLDIERSVESAFFEHVCEGYVRFMAGEDEEEFDQEFIERIESVYAKDGQEIEELRKQLDKKKCIIEGLKEKLGGNSELERRKKKVVEDLNMLISHERQLEVKKNKYIAAIEKIADEIKGYEQSIENLIQVKNSIVDKINQQTVNPEDIKGMNIEKVNLFKELERMKPEREAAMKNLLSIEAGIHERAEDNEKALSDLLNAPTMRIIEESIEKVKGLNLEIMNGDVDVNMIKSLGIGMLQKVEDLIVGTRETLVNHEIHVATLEETISEKGIHLKDVEEQYEHLNTKLKTVGAIYLEKKEIADRNRQKNRSEMDKLDNDLLRLKLENDSVYLRSEKECSEAKIKLDILLSSIRREQEEISKAIWYLYSAVEQQFKVIEQVMKDLKASVKR